MHHLLIALALFSFSSAAQDDRAAEDQKPELMPLPRLAEPPSRPILVLEAPTPPAFYRKNRYDVWQAYEVDRQGYFRARVIYGPSGAYYYYNGQPYPWTTTQPLNWKPVIVD